MHSTRLNNQLDTVTSNFIFKLAGKRESKSKNGQWYPNITSHWGLAYGYSDHKIFIQISRAGSAEYCNSTKPQKVRPSTNLNIKLLAYIKPNKHSQYQSPCL